MVSPTNKVASQRAVWRGVGFVIGSVLFSAPGPGADLRGNAAAADELLQSDPRQHWAFQPVRKPTLPKVKNATWVKTPVDAFILTKLEERNWKPAPPANLS